ncbi:YggT family protein [Treponema endosymbiont of Eucomonympha sp.]|uniref:YggT family protein n=1 Tax=Treponema endosymbiont of Eucomonympha sp. TaxID=1580831 RepID=UPI000AB13A05|nr:YggT family protein [Treponema endosymbiont of Eucomonympha sp.]
MRMLFNAFSVALTVYSLLCFVRIMLTWFGGSVSYSPLARVLSQACDPYLDLFRGIPFLRVGYLDFSPLVALAALSALSSVCGSIAATGALSAGTILALALRMCWSVVSSILSFLILMLAVRLVADLIAPNSTFQLWATLDRLLWTPVSAILRAVSPRRSLSRRAGLGIALGVLILLNYSLGWVMRGIAALLSQLPF